MRPEYLEVFLCFLQIRPSNFYRAITGIFAERFEYAIFGANRQQGCVCSDRMATLRVVVRMDRRSCQHGIDIMQSRVEDYRHCPIKIGGLGNGCGELLVRFGFRNMF